MSLALLGATIVFIQIGLPFIKLYKIGEALAELPSDTVTEKEYVQQTTTIPQTTTIAKPTIEPIEDVVEEIKIAEDIDNSFDEIEIVINSINETEERTEWEDPVEVVYVVNMTLNNVKHNGNIFYDLISSKVVDSQGQLGDERYSLRDDKDDIIPQGRSGECIIGVGLQHRGDFTITFFYYDDLATRHELEYTCKVD